VGLRERGREFIPETGTNTFINTNEVCGRVANQKVRQVTEGEEMYTHINVYICTEIKPE